MSDLGTVQTGPPEAPDRPLETAIEARHISKRFGDKQALDDASLRVAPGEIHALLGPNGAGKTTLVRILTGLAEGDSGEVRVLGSSQSELMTRAARSLIGLVPSGDRTFYLRLSGVENLVFFARMHGLRKARAMERARELIELVGLTDAADRQVGKYSHGMQKRLGVARGLLMRPPILFVDEATHDLDPQAALRVQELVADTVAYGTAVVWATQRIDEIRGFADRVTLLREGRVRFEGTVPQFMGVIVTRRFLVQLRAGGLEAGEVLARGRAAVAGDGTLEPSSEGDDEHVSLELRDGVVLGDVLVALSTAGIQVLACRDERSEVEQAFLHLTSEEGS
jgi:ABC-2 type transport system ATP-binding protein